MKIGFFDVIRKDQHVCGLPNFLTLARLVFVPVVVYFLSLNTSTGDLLTIVAIFLAATTDFLDGFFARRLNQRSQTGRMLDPMVDKLGIGIVMLALAAYKSLPYWYVFIVIIRDITILSAGAYVLSRKRWVVEANLLGKCTLFSFVVVILCYILNIDFLKNAAMWISILLMPISLVQYSVVNLYRIIKRNHLFGNHMNQNLDEKKDEQA